jgi:hypothetical protein
MEVTFIVLKTIKDQSGGATTETILVVMLRSLISFCIFLLNGFCFLQVKNNVCYFFLYNSIKKQNI